MNKRPNRGYTRFGSTDNSHLLMGQRRGKAVIVEGKGLENPIETIVYIGPSEDGEDKEYVKVVSGKINVRKPSFAY